MWLNTVTILARRVRLLPAYMREDVHATRQLHCHWWSGQWHAKHAENAPSVQNTCLDKIVCYLQRIFNRNRKLKQQGSKKVNCITIGCVCSKIKVCYVFVCIFFQICQHSNFLLLQGSVATYWRYDGKYYLGFVRISPDYPAVKEF